MATDTVRVCWEPREGPGESDGRVFVRDVPDGQTVLAIWNGLSDVWGIPGSAVGRVDGQLVSVDYVTQPGDVLRFEDLPPATVQKVFSPEKLEEMAAKAKEFEKRQKKKAKKKFKRAKADLIALREELRQGIDP